MKRNIAVPTIDCGDFTLRPFRKSDMKSLQQAINDPSVARDVTNIPYPYTRNHAKSWVNRMTSCITTNARRVDVVIDVGGAVAGSIAFINLDPS